MLKALLWDVDGTLAETERDGHLVAFNCAFAESGLPWRWTEARYGELLTVAGGRERLLRALAAEPDAPPNAAERIALVERLHRLKNRIYAGMAAGGALRLRAGVMELLTDCRARGVWLAIVTTTSRANVEALLTAALGRSWTTWFASTTCAEDAPRKKPDPQAYTLALQSLGLRGPETLAIEDAPAGVRAAAAAGVPVVRVRSFYFPGGERSIEVAVGPSLIERAGWEPLAAPPIGRRIDLAQLRDWHRQHTTARRGPAVSDLT